MYRTKWVLKNVNKKTGLGRISIEVNFPTQPNRERVYISTDEVISKDYWKSGGVIKSCPNRNELIRRLEDCENKVKGDLYQVRINEGYVNAHLFKKFIEENSKPEKDFLTLFEEYMEVKKLTAKHKMVIKLRTIRNQLDSFLGSKKMYLSDYNQHFINRLTHYWQEVAGLQPNTIHKNFRFILLFLNYLYKEGRVESDFFKKYQYPRQVETNTIVLSREEVNLLSKYNPKSESLRKVKSFFLIMIYSGLRFSDAYRINSSWIRGDFLFVNTQKTGEKVSIPLHPKLREILEANDFTVSKIRISNQKFNSYVKDLCKEAGITNLIEIVRFEKGEKKFLAVPKYKLIASHTGRRTFITNSILAGIPLPVIQKITGHRKLSTIQGYIEISGEDKVLEMNKMSKYFEVGS